MAVAGEPQSVYYGPMNSTKNILSRIHCADPAHMPDLQAPSTFVTRKYEDFEALRREVLVGSFYPTALLRTLQRGRAVGHGATLIHFEVNGALEDWLYSLDPEVDSESLGALTLDSAGVTLHRRPPRRHPRSGG